MGEKLIVNRLFLVERKIFEENNLSAIVVSKIVFFANKVYLWIKGSESSP